MIPDFDVSGILPQGEYRTTPDEIIQRFGSISLRRKNLTQSLGLFMDFVREHALRVYIDGSYITSKLSPGDVDILVVMPNNFDFNSDIGRRLAGWVSQRRINRLHIFVLREGRDDRQIRALLNDFTQDFETQLPKGILRLER